MAIRKTESRIPGGFTLENTQFLGDVGEIIGPEDKIPNTPDCFLVSFLTSPITEDSTNTYIVFINDGELATTTNSYTWRVLVDIVPANRTVEIYNETNENNKLDFSSFKVYPIIVEVNLKNGDTILRTIQLKQEVKSKFEGLERLIQFSEIKIDEEILSHSIALGAHPDTSREILNDFYEYIKIVYNECEDTNKVPLDFLSAILYLQIYRVPKERTESIAFENRFRHPELDNIALLLNGESSWAFSSEFYNSIGVSQISPSTLAMLKEYIDWEYLPEEEDEREDVRDGIIKKYENLTPETKNVQVDLFNILRFPKSNIKACFELLNHLKNRPTRYPDLSTVDFLNKDDAIELIATEFEIGGTETALNKAKSNNYGKSALKVLRSPLFKIGFGGEFELKVKGKVEDESDSFKKMEGAKVYLYKTQLYLFRERKCYKSEDIRKTTPDTDYVVLEGYKITESVITKLGLSVSISNKLRLLGGQFDIKDDFVAALKHMLSDDEFNNNSISILKEALIEISKEENHISLTVLEVKREVELPGDTTKCTLVKVTVNSSKLNYNEGWIISKYGDQLCAKLISEERQEVATVTNNNEFEFSVNQSRPYFIRVVKEPDEEHNGYFDGEINEEIENLPLGWFLPPKDDLVIKMKRARFIIRESQVTNLLNDWLEYRYSETVTKPGTGPDADPPCLAVKAHAIDYPDTYHVHNTVPLANWIESDDKDIDCCTFVESIIVEAFHNTFSDFFNWSKLKHGYAMPYAGLDKFSPVWIHMSRIIIIEDNPDDNTNIEIIVKGISQSTTSASMDNTIVNLSRRRRDACNRTARNIFDVLSANVQIKNLVKVFYESDNNNYILLRPKNIGAECDFDIIFNHTGGNLLVTPINTNTVLPALSIDISDETQKLPYWMVSQGWHSDSSGHAFFIVDSYFKKGATTKILRMESNSSRNLNGTGFGSMGKINENNKIVRNNSSGDFDNQKLSDDSVSANKHSHWIEKVESTWQETINYYNHLEDDINPIGLGRLKLYDLNWTKPIL